MTASLESQLRRYGAYLEETDEAGELRPVDHPPGRRPARSGRLVLVGALVLFVVVVVGIVVRAAVEDSAPVSSHSGSGWVRLPEPPLSPRSNAAIGWTGEEILVFGGSTYLCPSNSDCIRPDDPPFRDGAAYDPQSGRWRSIAPTPVPVDGARTVALNGEAYALVEAWPRTQTPGPQQLLRYRPSEDRWQSYELPRQARGLVATDDSIALAAAGSDGDSARSFEFHPDDESWTDLPVDPLADSYDRQLVWVNHSLVLMAKPARNQSDPADPGLVRTARLVDGTWVGIAGDGPFWSEPAIADGNRIAIPLLGCADGGASNPFVRCVPYGGVLDLSTSAWSDLPEAPVPVPSGQVDETSAGATNADQLLLLALKGWVLDLTSNTWIEVPLIDEGPTDLLVERSFSGAGPYGFAFGGSRFTRLSPRSHGELLNEAWIWKPPTEAAHGS